VHKDCQATILKGSHHSVFFIYLYTHTHIYIKINVHTAAGLLSVLHGYDIWAVKLKTECSLSMFDKMVLWVAFWPKKMEVTAEWMVKLHSGKLHD